MIQIAIWGIAAMLLVKALDVLHQQSISRSSGSAGSEGLSTGAAVFALLAAIALVYLADKQVEAATQQANPLGFVDPTPARFNDSTSMPRSAEDAGEAANKAASEVQKAASEAEKAASEAAGKM